MFDIIRGLLWVVSVLVLYKIGVWIWPLVVALCAAGLSLLGYALIGVVILAVLFVIGRAIRMFTPKKE